MKYQGIYKIRNLLNGKVYIGQSVDLQNRFRCHKHDYKKLNYYLYRAIRKYGINNFEFIIIEHITDCKKLDEIELYWINHYKSNDPNYGYNIRIDCRTNKGVKRSKETKEKLSYNRVGKRHSEDTKNNMSKIMLEKWKDPEYANKIRGMPAWNKGIPISKEQRSKISNTLKNLWQDPVYRINMLKKMKQGIKSKI